jgi:hypothetical protein
LSDSFKRLLGDEVQREPATARALGGAGGVVKIKLAASRDEFNPRSCARTHIRS